MASEMQGVISADDERLIALIANIPSEHIGTSHIATVLDTQGMTCPMPLLKAKLALRSIGVGDSLYLIASDKNSQTDITAFCVKQGIVCKQWHDGDEHSLYHFILTKMN